MAFERINTALQKSKAVRIGSLYYCLSGAIKGCSKKKNLKEAF